jgi:hypothetical protein
LVRLRARKSAVNCTCARKFSASVAKPRSRAVVNAMIGSPWLWQVKHCSRFSIDPARACFEERERLRHCGLDLTFVWRSLVSRGG